MKNLLSFDFSMSKPASCILFNNEYHFYAWPKDFNEKDKNIFLNAGVNIIDRIPSVSLKDIMQTEIKNASNLSETIILSLKEYLTSINYVAFEGLSYGSHGNVILSLAGYRYIFQNDLSKYISNENIYTYSPLTIKSIAGCSKKGMTKGDMIKAFIEFGPDCKFRNTLKNNPEIFQTKRAKNWVVLIDDLIDSYWAMQTMIKKENII